jgi:ABC-type multidrug transport system ATPase subunit
VEGLGKRYGTRWVFRGLEFALEPGVVLAVLGRNGSGKTTLLKVLAGLVPASSGRVCREREASSDIGYSAVDLALYPELTAREHLQLASAVRGCAPRLELLETVGLSGSESKPAAQMSTGMRARLKLALAVQHQPRVLLLDEPSACLDAEGRSMVHQVVISHVEHGAVVLATNDPIDKEWATHEMVLG